MFGRKNKQLRVKAEAITIEVTPPEEAAQDQALSIRNGQQQNEGQDKLLDDRPEQQQQQSQQQPQQQQPWVSLEQVKQEPPVNVTKAASFLLPKGAPDEISDESDSDSSACSSVRGHLTLSSLKRSVSKSSILSAMDNVREKVTISNIRKQADQRKLTLVVTLFFLIVVAFIAAAHVIYFKHIGELRLFGHLKLEESERRMLIYDSHDSLIIEGQLAVTLPHDVHPYPCIDTEDLHHRPPTTEGVVERCLEWKNLARLNIRHKTEEKAECYSLSWQSLSENVSPMDCFPVGESSQGHWYGGGESLQAAWPLEKGQVLLSAFVTGDEGQTEWGNLIRKNFLNSRGLSLTVEDHTPLFVSLNQGQYEGLCFQAKFDDFAYFYHRFELPRLNYTVCADNSIKELQRLQLQTQDLPVDTKKHEDDIERLKHLMRKPIWQVPVLNEPLSEEQLISYIHRVVGGKSRQPNNAVLTSKPDRGYLLLGYHWQQHMGDLTFNPERFSDVKGMIEKIRAAGLKLILTVNPFISTQSTNFIHAVNSGYFVVERNATYRTVPALTWFKDVPSAGLLDVTNNDTVDWIKGELKQLIEELGEQDVFFYVDAGNTFHTPHYFQFQLPLDNPDLYRDEFVSKMIDEVPVIGVSSAASKRPHVPAFTFMTPLHTEWKYLQTIIPNTLQLSVIGYPFVNPGPVGGIGHKQEDMERSDADGAVSASSTAEEDWELYLRWFQLATFMPMLHFFKPPTAFPIEMIETPLRHLRDLRINYVTPQLEAFSDETLSEGTPLIRPLWMLDPTDPFSQKIDDQFLLGNNTLVAPILKYGQRARDVYLPNGEGGATIHWQLGDDDMKVFKGGQWLNDFQVELNEVLFFIRRSDINTPRP